MNRPDQPRGQGAGRAEHGAPNRGAEPGGPNRGGSPAEMNRPGQFGGPNRPSARPQGPPNRPGGGRPEFNNGRAPERPRPNYKFRQQDRARLLQHYRRALPRVDRGHRPHFARGAYFPRVWLPYLSPVPPSLLGYLPPIPPGYAVGYYQGYVVVYDPATFFMLGVVDLLT